MEFIISNLILLSVILFFSCWQSVQDIKNMHISKWLQFLSIGVAAVVQVAIYGRCVWIYFVSAAIFSSFYFVVGLICRGKFGSGDVYFGIFQGLFLPIKMLPLCLAVEIMAAFLVEFLIKKNKSRFPFIPYMAFGLLMCWIKGNLF